MGGVMPTKRTRTTVAERLEALAGLDLSELSSAPRADTVGIVSLPIDQIRPDPFQARRILPGSVREGYLGGQLDPAGALLAWREMAEDDPAEANQLAVLRNLAASLQSQKQINPITVHRMPD